MGVKSSKPSNSTALAPSDSSKRKGQLRLQIIEGNEQDFYELFEIEHYTPWSEGFKNDVERSYRLLARMYHPDKNLDAKEECEAIMKSLVLAKETLLDQKKKNEYDRHLRADRKEHTKWDTFRWATKWGVNISSILGGSVALVAGLVGAVPSAGTTLALTAGGAGAISAGIRGAQKTRKDPYAPLKDWGRACAGSFVSGALNGEAGGYPTKSSPSINDCTGYSPERAREQLAHARELRGLLYDSVPDVLGTWKDKDYYTIEIQRGLENFFQITHSLWGITNPTVDEFYKDGKFLFIGYQGDLSGSTITWSSGNTWRKDSPMTTASLPLFGQGLSDLRSSTKGSSRYDWLSGGYDYRSSSNKPRSRSEGRILGGA